MGKKKAVKRSREEAGVSAGADAPAATTPTPSAATTTAAAAAAVEQAGLSKCQRKKLRRKEAAAAVDGSAAADAEDLTDLFSGLKGKKEEAAKARKAASDKKAAEGEGAAGLDTAGRPGKPYVTGPHKGYIPAGGNIAKTRMTLSAAKDWALKNQGCLGFTYDGRPDGEGRITAHFKNKWPVQGLDDPSGSWTSYRVNNRV